MARRFICSRHNEDGQSLVEMALVLPFLLLILLGIVQFGFVFSGYIAVTSAAREGARLAATGAANTQVQARVNDMLNGSPLLSDVQVTIMPEGTRTYGSQVSVSVRARCPVIMPLPVALAEGTFNLSAQAVMRMEAKTGGEPIVFQLV